MYNQHYDHLKLPDIISVIEIKDGNANLFISVSCLGNINNLFVCMFLK